MATASRKTRSKLVDQKKLLRFKTFSESLSEIRIDVVRKVDSVQYAPQGSESYFSEGLAKWKELNCSEDFVLFSKEVYPLTQSLHQVIHHKVEIIAALKKYLGKKNSLATEPLLELLVQFARDVQGDFYPHFSEFFPILTSLLNCKDAALIEQVFQCLAYLMKFLWRTLVQDIHAVFGLYTELLESFQPKHIKQFAAEGLAYLVRKIHNVSAVADVMFEAVDENHELTEGVGLLLFETCKGVQKHLHSNTAKVLSVLLSKLGPVHLVDQVTSSAVQSSKVFDCLVIMINSLVGYTRREYSAVVWTTLTDAAFKVLHKWSSNKGDSLSLQLMYILHLIGIWVSWKSGSLVASIESLVSLLHAMFDEDGYPQDLQNVLFQLFASFLLMSNSETLDDAKRLVKKIYHQGHHPELMLAFTKQVFNWKHFASVVGTEIPLYMESCVADTSISNISVLVFGSTLVLQLTSKWRLIGEISTETSGLNISLLPGSSHDNTFFKYLCTIFEDFKKLSISSVAQSDIHVCWCAVICLPACHLGESQRKVAVDLLTTLVSYLIEILDNDLNSLHSHLLFLLGHTLNSLACTTPDALDSLGESTTFMLLRKYANNVYILNGILRLFTSTPNSCGDKLTEVLPVLKQNILSPLSEVRLVTLEMLCFLYQHSAREEGESVRSDVLVNCLAAERLGVSLQTIKMKLMYLERLKFHHDALRKGPKLFKEIALMYLCSMLYVNFSPLWPPVTTVITSYAVDDCKALFWDVFGTILVQSSELAEKSLPPVSKEGPEMPDKMVQCGDLYTYYSALSDWKVDDGKADHVNFRYLMWRVIERIPEFVERKSKIIVPIFMDFIQREFTAWENSLVDYQSISSTSSSVSNGKKDVLVVDDREVMDTLLHVVKDNEDSASEEENIVSDMPQAQMHNSCKSEDTCEPLRKRNSLKTLKQLLTVFCLFKNPKGLYQHKELQAQYHSLLLHRDSSIQELAMKCIATFKQPEIRPYIDNLMNLLDDTEFNTELLKFSSSSEQYIVLMDHTPSLIPVLVRILYGRMLKHGQTKAAVRRRGIVLRFLETCRLSELQEFIGLVLAPFLKTPVLESPDPQCVVPLRKQQGFLKLCGQMIVALKEDIVPFAIDLLNISLRLTKHASIFLDMRKQIATQYVSLLRNIRQLGIQVVTQMFEVFVDFPFSNFEDSIFESIVWPQLGKLPNECIQNPTPLLKLIHQWSMHSRYHQYFLKCLPESSLPILHYVYSCLFSKQVSFSVTDMVFQVTVNLLQEMNREDCPGYQAVSPHLGSILQYISQKWSVPSPKKKVLLTDTELKVLSMISPLVTDTTTAVKFVDVILNFVSHGSSHCKGENTEVNMLKTVKNLAAHIASPERYLRILSRLFFTVSSRHSRQMLCDILQEMTKGSSHLESVADTVTDLNSWNTAHVDEPDYMIRIEAFGKCPSHLGCVQNFEEVVLLLVNNAMFFLLTASDLSIRDSAAGFISRLIDHDRVNSEEKCADFTIQALFHGILQGLRSHNDTSYNEVIAVLGQLVKSHKGHPKLKEMVILSDPDPEADFFENVRHIQVHRRTRAFLKLESLIVKEQFRVSTLTDIFLPMASHVVASSAMQKEHNLLSAVIDVLGAVASLVKWSTYKYVLMKYLKLLAKKPAREKTLMKVVVAILNAFHFGCTIDESTLPADGSEVMMSDHEECSEDVMERDVEEQNSIPQNIRDSIVHTILPELKAKLLVRDEHSHLEILRSPLVLAMTKLLQSLPKAALHSHLPGILLKICSQLKNRDRDTRDMARNALVKIAQSLGPCYVPYIVKEMKESLTKGYQVHILDFSIYALLTGLSQHLNSGDLDPCSVDVREILVNDLFGAPEEERDTPEAIKKLPEAKTSKSNDCFELLVSKLSPKEVPDIIESLLKILKDQPTAKVSKQVSEVLRRVSLGILGNAGFPVEQVLLLVHGLLVDSVPGMSRNVLEENAKSDLHQSKETILLPPEPRRGGPKPVTQLNITAHVVAHFGLQLTVATLKKHKLQSPNHLQMIDPFIEILSTTIKSKHTNIISVTLKCLRELLPYPLPAMKTGLPGFIEELFSILGKYSKHGAAIGPNQELVATAFRAMTDIISISHEAPISEAQLQLLLTFIEEDIHDPQRQSTAFPLLKAIIARKLVVPEIHDVMGRIIQLSVVSDSETTRSQCRLVTCHFLLDYPLGKRIYKYLGAILSNLSYEVQSGRESVLELCNFFFTKFPPRLLHKQATFFFIPLSSQLVNDSSPVCKEMVAVAMKKLLERLDGSKRSELADFLLHWLNSKNLLHQQVAVQALGLFIEVEAENFQKRLTPFLPLLFQCLDSPSDDHDEINSGGVVNMDDSSVDRNHISSDGVAAEVPEETSTMVALRSSTVLENPLLHDHLLFITLSCFGKILIKCSSVLKDPSYADTLNKLWNRAEEFLFYPHTWVKLCACKLFGLLFAVYPPANVATSSHDIVCEYLTSDPRSKATILFNKFYKILKVQSLNPEISDQVVKNMVFCTRVIYHHQLDDKASLDASNDLVKKQIMKMEKLARLEAGNCPKDSSKRLCVLKWIGALAVNFDPKIVEVYLSLLLKPVYRELANEQTIGGDCHKLAEEVAEVIAKILGRDTMAVANASVQKEFSLSKERRKRKIAMDAVVNPEIAARRKIRKNIRKKVQRKIKGRISRLCK